MKVPYAWLREYCDPGLEPEELAERLTMTGTELERIGHSGAPAADGFVVGAVLEAEQHPNADRLRVCKVDVGESEPRTIVCGAPNVAAGQTVAVALPGAVMPGGMKLGRAKLRGIESDGMILSETEMEAGVDSDGITVLADAEPGRPLTDVVPISDPVLELEITPNRPDCLGVWGVAREVHAATGAPLAAEPWAEDAEATGAGEVGDYASVTVEVPELCPRFTARVFTDVEIGPSPLWLKQRLSAAGQRPINNVVDITNYVMLLTGQPLHAFDLDKVPDGALIVRNATDGEKMTTLDGTERTFDSEAVLVCDRSGPSGIAGIMGGEVSEVSDSTTRVLMEVATWDGSNILSTSGKLALRSEASGRFEKQLHPEQTMRAQRVAARLMVELCGAKMVPGTIDVDAGLERFAPLSLTLRVPRVEQLLGMPIDAGTCVEYLERLGFGAEADSAGETIAVTVPADRRTDTTREVDLIEEVGRLHGIDERLPATLPARPPGPGALAPHQRLLRRAEDVLRDAGLDEAITWSFVGPSARSTLGLEPGGIVVHNPLSEEGSVMRTGLIGGLIDAAAHNRARGAGRIALFESGRAYLPGVPDPEGGVLDGTFSGRRPAPAVEPHRLGAIVCGAVNEPGWRAEAAPADFFGGKGLVELLLDALAVDFELAPPGTGAEGEPLPFLHPGRSAIVRLASEGRAVGWLGEIHPRLAADAGLPEPAVAFELDMGPIAAASALGMETYEDLTSFPALLEDLAIVVDGRVSAAELTGVVKGAGGELLRKATIFDVYEGEQVEAGKRSLAVRLEFQAPDRTLTDEEVADQRAAIVAAVEGIGGTLRG